MFILQEGPRDQTTIDEDAYFQRVSKPFVLREEPIQIDIDELGIRSNSLSSLTVQRLTPNFCVTIYEHA